MPMRRPNTDLDWQDPDIEPLATEFVLAFDNLMPQISDHMATLASGDDRVMASVTQIQEKLYDLQAVAKPFAYMLIEQIADQACRHIDHMDGVTDADIETIQMHVEALRAAKQSARRGAIDPIGREVLSALKTLVRQRRPNSAQCSPEKVSAVG